MTRNEYTGLPLFLPDNPPHLHIDKFSLFIQGIFQYEDLGIFREFMRSLGSNDDLFTTKGRHSRGVPYFQFPKKRYLVGSKKIDYRSVGNDRCIIQFPLVCNLTRYIANHPYAFPDGATLNDVMRRPPITNPAIPPLQRVNRWFQSFSAKKVCLDDNEDNILRGREYMQCNNVAERFAEYIALIQIFIEGHINEHIVQTDRQGAITFAWDRHSMLFDYFEAYHDYQTPDALTLVRSLHRNLEHLSSVVNSHNYVTQRRIDGFSISLPLRDEKDLECTFYAKTHHRVRVELRYWDNIRQLINRLPHPEVGIPAFINGILEHANEQLEHV